MLMIASTSHHGYLWVDALIEYSRLIVDSLIQVLLRERVHVRLSE